MPEPDYTKLTPFLILSHYRQVCAKMSKANVWQQISPKDRALAQRIYTALVKRGMQQEALSIEKEVRATTAQKRGIASTQ